MASVKAILKCIGVDTDGRVSILRDLFGFSRGRVPPEQVANLTAQVSVLQLLRDLKGEHVHLNIIRVGFDALSADEQATAMEQLDYAVFRIRNIYRPVQLGIGRVEHFIIDSDEANGRDVLGSEDEADQLCAEFTAPGDGIDVFVVREFQGTVAGISPIGGNCDKDAKNGGLVGGEIRLEFEQLSRTFAPEIGHFLGLWHTHLPGFCPTGTADRRNLMTQSICDLGPRVSVLLTDDQGKAMRGHCSIRSGC